MKITILIAGCLLLAACDASRSKPGADTIHHISVQICNPGEKADFYIDDSESLEAVCYAPDTPYKFPFTPRIERQK